MRAISSISSGHGGTHPLWFTNKWNRSPGENCLQRWHDFRLTGRSQTRQEGTCPNSARRKYTQQTEGACSAWGAQPSWEVRPGASPGTRPRQAPPPPPCLQPTLLNEGGRVQMWRQSVGWTTALSWDQRCPCIQGDMWVWKWMYELHLCGKLTYLLNPPHHKHSRPCMMEQDPGHRKHFSHSLVVLPTGPEGSAQQPGLTTKPRTKGTWETACHL